MPYIAFETGRDHHSGRLHVHGLNQGAWAKEQDRFDRCSAEGGSTEKRHSKAHQCCIICGTGFLGGTPLSNLTGRNLSSMLVFHAGRRHPHSGRKSGHRIHDSCC